jgi:hypothetical protein
MGKLQVGRVEHRQRRIRAAGGNPNSDVCNKFELVILVRTKVPRPAGSAPPDYAPCEISSVPDGISRTPHPFLCQMQCTRTHIKPFGTCLSARDGDVTIEDCNCSGLK